MSPFLTLTALLMPTACKSAPFGIEVTRMQLQNSRHPTLDVKVIRRIPRLEFDLLSIVHDHYGHESIRQSTDGGSSGYMCVAFV